MLDWFCLAGWSDRSALALIGLAIGMGGPVTVTALLLSCVVVENVRRRTSILVLVVVVVVVVAVVVLLVLLNMSLAVAWEVLEDGMVGRLGWALEESVSIRTD